MLFRRLSFSFQYHCHGPIPFSGAELISVLNSDENKTFGVVFRTPVDDSTGIPHILEHSVLCGSRKYPIKVRFVGGGDVPSWVSERVVPTAGIPRTKVLGNAQLPEGAL